jgi:hypothetical protein
MHEDHGCLPRRIILNNNARDSTSMINNIPHSLHRQVI